MIPLRVRRWIMIAFAAPLLAGCGCDVQMGNWGGQNQYEKIVEKDTTLAKGSMLDVDTSFGSVTVTGGDTNACHVTATITGRAPSEEEAEALAEQVAIRLEQSGHTLKIRADKPKLGNNRSIGVSYVITAPRQIDVLCHSSYGSLNLADLAGTVKAKSGSGSIEAQRIEGDTDLDTAYGSIRCSAIHGPEVTLHSGSGSIEASDIAGNAKMASSYGSVKCAGFADGDLELKSGSGRVELSDATFGTCEANSSYGPVSGRHIEGDAIKLRSSSGSVEVTDATVGTMDLSSSYGRVRAHQIVTKDITAHSGSGSIDIECATNCPADLTANIKTSYGSVDVAAPADFTGEVYLATSYGSVQTDRPVTIQGQISKKKITGTIGDGPGRLHLETSSGSIHLH